MKGILKSSAAISAMTMISRILGLVRDMVFFHLFPAGGVTDAFLAANRIPNLLRRFVAEGAFSLAFVPVLAEYKETRSKEDLHDLLDHVATTLGLILFTISVIGVIAAPIVMMIFAPGFQTKEGAEPELAASLLRITFPYIFFISLSALASGILNTWSKFAIPAFTPVLLNVSMIAAMLLFSPYFEEPITAVAWGVFMGGVAQLAFQLPALFRLGLIPKFRYKKGHAGVKKVLKLMTPALFGSSIAQINLLINTAIASMLGVGFVSWLYSSDRFVELPLALFGVALGVVILPKLSKDYANTDKESFSAMLDWAIRLALLVAIPAMVGLMVLAKPILVTVFYSNSAWHNVEMSSMSLIAYSFGLPAFILVKVLAPGFYSRQNTKTPVKIGIISVVVNIALSLLIVFPWYKLGFLGPHAGLALAVALAGYVNAGLLYITLHEEGVLIKNQGWLLYFLRIAVAVVIMAFSIIYLMPNLEWWQVASFWYRVVALVVLIVVALLTYLLTVSLLGINLKKMIKGA
jgi:putative peptidoglycan lipid II flippase